MKYDKVHSGWRWTPPEGTCTESFTPPPPLPPNSQSFYYRRIRQPFFTILFFGSLAVHSMLIVVFLHLPSLLLYAVPSWRLTIYRDFIRFTQRAWVEYVHLLCYFFAPTVLHITGDDFPFLDHQGRPERIILMANHMTFADWIYLWLFAMHVGAHGNVKIIMKEELKRIPIFGWGMQFFDFIFLKRNWDSDRKRLAKAFDIMAVEKQPIWLMLFPEGTLISDQTMEVNLAYAEKAGLDPIPRYCLLPRATGLEFILRHLNPCLAAIYDVTMAYEGARPQYPQNDYTLTSIFVQSRPPPRVHMHLKRYTIEEFMQHVDVATELQPAPSLEQLVASASVTPEPQTNQPLFSLGLSPESSTLKSSSSRPGAKQRKSPNKTQQVNLQVEMAPSRPASPLPSKFTLWLREYYLFKDHLLHQFYSTGRFPLGKRSQPLDIEVGVRRGGIWKDALSKEGALVREGILYAVLLMIVLYYVCV